MEIIDTEEGKAIKAATQEMVCGGRGGLIPDPDAMERFAEIVADYVKRGYIIGCCEYEPSSQLMYLHFEMGNGETIE